MMSENKLNITSELAEKGIDAAKGFLTKLLGPAIDEIGQVIAEPIRAFRFKNQISFLAKAEKIIKDKNIKTKVIPVKTLMPLLEYSSLEDDEDLQCKWANLLVNYIDLDQNYQSSVFPYILGQLSTAEAFQLDLFYENDRLNHTKLNVHDTGISNLIRLGLIEHTQSFGPKMFHFHSQGSSYNFYDNFHLTPLGKEFIICCSPRV